MSDDILEYIKETVTRIENKQDTHDTRLRAVERWQNDAGGKITMLSAIGVVMGAALAAAADFFKR